jgi:diguanylate cyclase (GGDEF)-like protein
MESAQDGTVDAVTDQDRASMPSARPTAVARSAAVQVASGSASGPRPIRRHGLRRQWRLAVAAMLTVLSVALVGSVVAYLQVVGHYESATNQLQRGLSLSSQLTDAIPEHEGFAHKLWGGDTVDETVYLRQQQQISHLFDEGLRDLHSPEEHRLLSEAASTWREVLTSRGLWAPSAHARPGVTQAIQLEFAEASDEVAGMLSRLSKIAISHGAHDLAIAHNLQNLVLMLLAAMFAAVVAMTLYLARRMTTDVVRPVEHLHLATARLRDGDLDHRIDVPNKHRASELVELADAFNAMAIALSESHRDLSRQATQDPLTGLANRAMFQTTLEAHLTTANNHRPETVSVLFIDVDDFKVVNDSLGHAAGDAVLVGIAERLGTCVRLGDVLARLGGDEFAILVRDETTDATAANTVAERIMDALNDPFEIAGQQVAVAVSIGISAAGPGQDNPQRLLAEADFAMYTAKRDGKGRHEVFQR